MMHELAHLLSDPAHWVGHVVMDLAVGAVLYAPFRALVARHDKRKHAPAEDLPTVPDLMAQAWDSGYDDGYDAARFKLSDMPNPYKRKHGASKNAVEVISDDDGHYSEGA